jgi:hypothetical protein
MTEPKRDRWGRYQLPHPVTGEEVAWTRATTLAKTLDDGFNIHKWEMRHVVTGVMMREDLQALALATDIDDKKQWDDLFMQAKATSQAASHSNAGTALHKFTQRLDQGQEVRALPSYERDVAAYRSELSRSKVEVSGRYIERITVVPEISVAGTMDRILRFADEPDHYYIGDLKTGKDVESFASMSIAIQLAIYSRGAGLWNPFDGKYDPMPNVDQDRGIVIHLPAGQAKPKLYWVDIATGWEMAKVCYQVREWRKRRDLVTPMQNEKEGEHGF